MRISLLSSIPFFVACTSSSPTSRSEMPPTDGGSAVEAWLATGDYKAWACEPAVHASRSPSPHGFNRICSNDVVSANATGSGAWPEGAAAVKELYGSADSSVIEGYAVYVKTAPSSDNGASWYWYERAGSDVVADGFGSGGTAQTICVACHMGAGTDANHTPSPGGRDEIYTPVQ